MTLNIIKELDSNQILLLQVSSENYNNAVDSITKDLSSKSICYVTLNKTFNSLKENFQKKKVNIKNMVFIDAISKTMKKTPDQEAQCYYVSAPSAMTEMSIVIGKFLKHEFDYLIFDSLNSMLVYEKKAPVSRFISSLVNKIKKSKTKAVFIALKGSNAEIITESGMFVDKVVDYSGKTVDVKVEKEGKAEKPVIKK